MFVGQSGTTKISGRSGWYSPQLKHAGRWLAKDMLPSTYRTPLSYAASSIALLDAASPWSVGGASDFGSGLYTPSPEYSGVLSTDAGRGRPPAAATSRLRLISSLLTS